MHMDILAFVSSNKIRLTRFWSTCTWFCSLDCFEGLVEPILECAVFVARVKFTHKAAARPQTLYRKNQRRIAQILELVPFVENP